MAAQLNVLARIRPNNLATALTMAIATQTVTGAVSTAAGSVVDALWRRLNDELGTSASFQSLTDRAKQSIYEELVVCLGIVQVFNGPNQNEAALRAESLALTRQALESLGLPAEL